MKLEVFFDYTCPYCYLAFHDLKQILPKYPEITIQWRPCEINPQTEPRMSDWDEASPRLIELRPRLKEAGLSIQRPFEPRNYTGMAIQGLLILNDQGADTTRYNDAVFAAVFLNGKDIESIDVLTDCAVLAGGDADAFRHALVSEAYKEKQLALNQYAWQENALDSVPSFRLGDTRLNAEYGIGVLRQQLAEFIAGNRNKKIRCTWAGDDPLYIDYHDNEWGRPVHNDNKLFEMLILEGMQAGLSWITILRKREAYRIAFDQFHIDKILMYDHTKIEELMQNAGIIRNRLKINSVITNAKAFRQVQEEFGSFDAFLWRYVNGKPIQNHWTTTSEVPATTELSDLISKELKKRGFKFVGSTIVYAYMQAVGLVNDHTVDCFVYADAP